MQNLSNQRKYVIGQTGHSITMYVDKMRGEGSKMSVFVHARGIKNVHAGGVGTEC